MKQETVTIAALAILVATCASAQDGATDVAKAEESDVEATSEDLLVEEGTSLGRIVVSAGQEKVAIDTPQAVSVVTSEDLERAQGDTVGDVIDDLPGVKVVGSERPLGESFNIRGIGAAAAADEPRIIVTIDGAPKYYEQYRMGSFFTDPDLFKSVEVLRGPASSTLYGTGAIGGVVSLETKDPSDFLTEDKDWALRQKFGTAYSGRGLGFLTSTYGAWRASDKAEFLVSGTFRSTPEYENGDGELVDGSDSETFSGLAKGVFKLGASGEHQLELAYSWFQTSLNDEPYSQTGLGGGVFAGFGTVDREIFDQTAAATYRYTPGDNPWIDLKIVGSYTVSKNDQSDVSPSLVYAFGDEWTIEYQTWQLKAENTVTSHGGSWENFVTFGGQFSFQDRVSEATLFGAPYAIGSHPAGQQQVVGAYVQSEFIYDGWLTLVPGARVDFASLEADDSVSAAVTRRSHDFTLFSPKIAAHAKLTDEVALFGSVARTERAPVIDELYDVDNYAGTASEGDPSKEVALNIEGGVALSFYDLGFEGDALKLKFTAFHTEIDDLIYRSSDGVPYGNAASAIYDGVELEAGYDAGFAFGSAAYTRIRGELQNGVYLDSIPADEFKLTAAGRWRPLDLEFGWTGTFAAGQDRVSNPASIVPGGGAPTDGYVVHDLFVGWKPQDGVVAGTEFRLTAENITDRSYREHLSGDDAPGLTLKFSAARSF